ncbi:MAG: energy transducer TonB [Bacteroides sp.]|nr:energy transducer TonB [Bacteroides sp.]MCM1413592.1 energy transducer TonB [Bacteroides sp.]MCM1471191.1 energy transducer TonB [Bacteroides sp.]
MLRLIIFTALAIFSFSIATAQNPDEYPVEDQSEYQFFGTVEEMPEFPGGIDALMNFLAANVKYPTQCVKDGIQGKVIVRFIVRSDGSIGDAEIARGNNPLLNAEALRVVRLLPSFNPGKLNGKPVDVWFALPITFKLPAK